MRRHLFLPLVILAMAASPVAAVTWGSYNPTARTITATVSPGRDVTVEMPYPKNTPGGFIGMDGERYVYNVSGDHYRLLLQFDGASLVVTIDSTESTNEWSYVTGPQVPAAGEFRRVDVSRYGGAKGFDFNQKATYVDQEDLWIWAFWQPENSHGTSWRLNDEDYNANSGSGNLLLTPSMIYNENLGDVRQLLQEVIEIRVGDGLWDAVPTFPQSRVSEWAEELAETVYIDAWSHDSAADLTHLVQTLKRIAGRETSFFTNWASWGSGGHADFLPDSLWLGHDPPYPPNHTGYGSLARMQALANVGRATGWLGFRTYYSVIKDESPSYQEGLISRVLKNNGSEGGFSKHGDWATIYERQEPEIHAHLGSSGIFTDSLSTGFPWNYRDYDAAVPYGLAMDAHVDLDRTFADYLETIHEGPVTGEGVSNEVLIGPWVDTGEYNMHNGRGRRMTPEYKLRRLHGLTTLHGMGLNYRFYDISQLWTKDNLHRNGWRAQDQLDDYRATQLLFGNGGFLSVENNLEDAPWGHYLSEVLMVAPLQRHFALQPVANVEYETSGQAPGTWYTLEELVEDHDFVMITDIGREWDEKAGEWIPTAQSPEFERFRVTYANGLTVVVNRGATDFDVNAGGESLTLPPTGWAIWGTPGGDSVLAYSAYAPGTSHRIDYLEDHGGGVRFVDPRGGTYFDVIRPTQWVWKNGGWRRHLEADLDGDWPAVTIEGQRFPLQPSRRQAADSLITYFIQGLGGWRTIFGARVATPTLVGLQLDLSARTPYLHSPRLALAGKEGDVIEVELRFDEWTGGPVNMAILFQREGDVAFHGDRFVSETNIPITGDWQTVTIDVGGHSQWDDSTIVRLRFDPLKAGVPPPAKLTLRSIRWVPAAP